MWKVHSRLVSSRERKDGSIFAYFITNSATVMLMLNFNIWCSVEKIIHFTQREESLSSKTNESSCKACNILSRRHTITRQTLMINFSNKFKQIAHGTIPFKLSQENNRYKFYLKNNKNTTYKLKLLFQTGFKFLFITLVFSFLGCNLILTYGSDWPFGSIGIRFFASLTKKKI